MVAFNLPLVGMVVETQDQVKQLQSVLSFQPTPS